MTHQLSMPRPWPDDVLRLFDVGGGDAMRVVGGVVRDTLLDRDLSGVDYDFATLHEPHAMMALLEAQHISVKPTGIDHGTVTAILNGRPYEITTLRRDVATDGRRAVVSYTKDWVEDAQRRDFTINALYADADGRIHDPTGQGLADIKSRTLRFIGDAETRIREDYLRILRLYRFLATVPGLGVEQSALRASEALAGGMGHLSGERVTAEIIKLLRGAHAAEALRQMRGPVVEWLHLSPQAQSLFEGLERWRPVISHVDDAVLLVLAYKDAWPDYLVTSRAVKVKRDKLLSLLEDPMSWEEAAFRHGPDLAIDLYIVRGITKNLPAPDSVAWLSIKEYCPPVAPVKAEDLQKEGFFSAELGRELKKRLEIWIAQTFR